MACVLASLATGGRARAADSTMAILGIEAAEGAPESVAVALTDALRQRASAERGTRLVAGRELLAIKIMFSCPDEAPSCMADAAKGLGASKLIFGSVKGSAGAGYVVTLKLLDAARRQIDNYVAEPISPALVTPGTIKTPVQKWFATLMGQSALGTIRVRGDVPGTAIALDGQPIGVIGSEDLIHSNVPAGRRELVASKPGYAPVRKEVAVSAGNTTDVGIQMASSSGSPFPSGSSPLGGLGDPSLGGTAGPGDDPTRLSSSLRDTGRSGLKLASWSTLVTSLTGFGLALKFALDINSINADLDPYRRYPCNGSTEVICAADRVTRKPPIQPDEGRYVTQLQDEGKRFEGYQYIALGAGSILAVASGVLFYFGYLAEDTSGLAFGGRGSLRLSLSPVVGPGSNGMAARLTF
jgi:PEGA domain